LEDGNLTDGKGRKVDFRNTIIIMTSNVGTEHIRRASGQGRTVLEAFPLAGATLAFKRLADQFSLSNLTKGTYGMATDGASLGV